MNSELVIQLEGEGRTLLRVMSELAEKAVEYDGVFAFASKAGVEMLLDDDAFSKLLLRGRCRIVVGVDAVTDRRALERLRDMAASHEQCEVAVVAPASFPGIFHPKVSCFRYGDGSQKLVVGSGNLTPGGLLRNAEAFLIAEYSPDQAAIVDPLQDFLGSHGALKAIDEAILKRAEKNRSWGPGGDGKKAPPEEADVVEVPGNGEETEDGDQVFVGFVPAGGGRWGQVHLNADIVEQFFHVPLEESSEFIFQERQSDGSRGPREERALVYSRVNKNPKIEIGAASGKAYPDPDEEGRPIVLMRRVSRNLYDYVLLMPSNEGHSELVELIESAEKEGRTVGRGLPRLIVDLSDIRTIWDGCPL